MSVRDEQKEKRRAEILNTALDLFIRKGYAATKVSDIAQAAGMSVGLLFHYFESKEKLYETLISFGVSGPMSVMAASCRMAPLAFFEFAADWIFNKVKADAFTAKMFVLMSEAAHSQGIPPGAQKIMEGFDIFAASVPLIQKGQEEGSIREGDPYALSMAFWSAIAGIAARTALMPEKPSLHGGWIVDIIRRNEQ